MAEYRYAMVNRPLSIGTCPKGWVGVEPQPAKGEPHHDAARHGILVYDRKLTEQEMRSYELAPILDDAGEAELAERVVAFYADDVEYFAGLAHEDAADLVMHGAEKAKSGYLLSLADRGAFVARVLALMGAK